MIFILVTLSFLASSQFTPFGFNTNRYETCKSTPWGNVAHGYTNTAYSSSTPVGVTCATVDEIRTCSDGSLSGSFSNPSCNNGCGVSTVSNCDLLVNSHGASSGTCESGYSGICSYSCSNGSRSLVSNTCASCAGTLVGGFCWYYSAIGDSCTSVCSTHGGYNSATQTYAGSAGTNANCNTVLNALSAPYGPTTSDSASCPWNIDDIGCQVRPIDSNRLRCTLATTSAGSSMSQAHRACACNN